MALSNLKQIPKDADKGTLVVDLSDIAGDGAELRFREPKAADLFPDSKELQSLRELVAIQEAQIYEKHQANLEKERLGSHVLDFAKRNGWPDDGEGAFEYIQRISYELGKKDATQ